MHRIAVLDDHQSTAARFADMLASGVAAKVLQEARKPHNQQKIRDVVAQMQAKRKGQGRKPGTRY